MKFTVRRAYQNHDQRSLDQSKRTAKATSSCEAGARGRGDCDRKKGSIDVGREELIIDRKNGTVLESAQCQVTIAGGNNDCTDLVDENNRKSGRIRVYALPYNDIWARRRPGLPSSEVGGRRDLVPFGHSGDHCTQKE